MCLVFLYDFICIYDSSNFIELSEGLLIIIQLLPLIVFIVLVAHREEGIRFSVIGTSLCLEAHLRCLRQVLPDLFLLLAHVLAPHLLHCYSPLLEPLQLSECRLLGVSCVVGQQKQLLKVVLFAFEAVFDAGELTVVAYSFLLEPPHNLFIGLLDGLGLVELDHHLVEPVLQEAGSPHHGILFEEAHFILLDLLELVLQGEKHILLGLGVVLFLIESQAEVVLIVGGGHGAKVAERSPGEYAPVLLGSDKLIANSL